MHGIRGPIILIVGVLLVVGVAAPRPVAKAAVPPGNGPIVRVRPQHLSKSTVAGTAATKVKDALVRQELFSAVVQEISDGYSKQFAAAEWSDPRSGRLPSVTLVGGMPAGVLAKLRRLPFDVQVRSGANANEGQLRELSAAAVLAVVEDTGGITGVSSTINSQDLGISIEYGGTERLQASLVATRKAPEVRQDELRVRVMKSLNLQELPVPIRITANQSSSATKAETTVRGGYSLTLNTGTKHCTSGFSAKRGSVKGVITADHCQDALLYGGKKNIVKFLSASPRYSSASFHYYYYDMQFHATLGGNSTSPSFRATSGGGIKTVKSFSNPVKGARVCHYGITSGQKCSVVYSTNVCIYFPGVIKKTYCSLVATKAHVSDGGDSGGPWFSGNVAKGTHTGRASLGSVPRSVFTPIGIAKFYMNLSVLKG